MSSETEDLACLAGVVPWHMPANHQRVMVAGDWQAGAAGEEQLDAASFVPTNLQSSGDLAGHLGFEASVGHTLKIKVSSGAPDGESEALNPELSTELLRAGRQSRRAKSSSTPRPPTNTSCLS